MTTWERLVAAISRANAAGAALEWHPIAASLRDYQDKASIFATALGELDVARIEYEAALVRAMTRVNGVTPDVRPADAAGSLRAILPPAQERTSNATAESRESAVEEEYEDPPDSEQTPGEALADRVSDLGATAEGENRTDTAEEAAFGFADPDDKWSEAGVLCRSKEGRERVVAGVCRVEEQQPKYPAGTIRVVKWCAQVRQGDAVLRDMELPTRREAKDQTRKWLKDEPTLAWARAARDGMTSTITDATSAPASDSHVATTVPEQDADGASKSIEPSSASAPVSKPAEEKPAIIPTTGYVCIRANEQGKWWEIPCSDVKATDLVYLRTAQGTPLLFGKGKSKTSVLLVSEVRDSGAVIYGSPCPDWQSRLRTRQP